MDGVFETQPDRTDLPLVVMPVVIESMIGPFKQNFTMLENVARVRMYEDFTLDEDTIVERCKDADAVMVIGFHCADAILDRLDAKCYAFGGTGVASYINLEKTKERGIRVCNVLHYGDHAVAEHAMALLMELTRHAGALDMQVKQGDWDGADGFELFGKKLGIIGLGGIGRGRHRQRFRHESIRVELPRAGTGVREPECHSGGRHERVDLEFRRGQRAYAVA
jgi:lactate dehydrogenase-like 2-hydroxyacid dehydrogenase